MSRRVGDARPVRPLRWWETFGIVGMVAVIAVVVGLCGGVKTEAATTKPHRVWMVDVFRCPSAHGSAAVSKRFASVGAAFHQYAASAAYATTHPGLTREVRVRTGMSDSYVSRYIDSTTRRCGR